MKYLVLFLFATAVHAEKCYVVTPLWDQTKQVIECAQGFTPPTAITEAPVDETGQPYPIEALDVVDEPDERDEQGNPLPGTSTHKVAKVNATKLDAKKKADKKAKDDADAADASKKKTKGDRMERIRIGCALLKAGDQLLKDICEEILDR